MDLVKIVDYTKVEITASEPQDALFSAFYAIIAIIKILAKADCQPETEYI